MDLSNLSRFPVNTRNYTVVPCIDLVYDNMHESMVGLKVTVGLGPYEEYGPTDSGTIHGFDEKKLHVKIGSKVKKFDYDPTFIQLQVYQFDHRIMFSNERVSEKELAASNRDFYNDSREKSQAPSPIQKKEEEDVKESPKKPKKTTRKKRSTAEKKSKESTASSSSYQPKFGIQWS